LSSGVEAVGGSVGVDGVDICGVDLDSVTTLLIFISILILILILILMVLTLIL